MAVVSHLVCSSSDAIGVILIGPISNPTSAQLLHVPSPVTESTMALGAKVPLPAFSASPQRETESAFDPGSVNTQVFCAAAPAALSMFHQSRAVAGADTTG